MAKKKSPKVVLDTNIGRSAGSTDEKPLSAFCRSVLRALLKMRFTLVLSPGLEDEWRNHESRFSKGWRTIMQQRGLVHKVDALEFAALGRRIANIAEDDFPAEALLKDLPVFASALATDRIVISNEVRLKKHLLRLGKHEDAVLELVWASPLEEGEDCAAWVYSGLRKQRNRKLRNHVE